MNKYRLLNMAPIPQGWRLWVRRSLMDRDVDRDRRRIIKNGGNIADVWADDGWRLEYQFLEEYEANFHSRQLLRRAQKLRIPAPPIFDGDVLSEDYRRSGLDGHRYYLSLAGEQKMRLAIREEEKYRSERRARYIPYITAVSGLVGTITGLVAVVAKWVG